MHHKSGTSTKGSGSTAALQTPPQSTDGSWTSALELRPIPLRPPDSLPSPRTKACRTTVVRQAAGVKRGRTEDAPIEGQQYDWFSWDKPLSLCSSDDESCDSLFATGGGFAEPEDSSLVSLIWDPGSCLGRLRASLLDPAYTWFTSWRAIAQYAVPPDDRLPPRKRVRISPPGHGQTPPLSSSSSYVKAEDESDSDLVVVSSPRGFFHLACPFYVSNPESHRSCVEQHDFGSIRAVRSHLRRDHLLPPYCGNCRRIFSRAADRDRHHGLRACESRKWIKVQGLDERQRQKLRRPEKAYLGETRQWERVWDIVFPKAAARPSPYLTGGVGLTVSMLRDFWAGNGRDIVLQAMDGDAELQQYVRDENVVAWLGQAVLEDLVAKVVDDHGTGKEVMS